MTQSSGNSMDPHVVIDAICERLRAALELGQNSPIESLIHDAPEQLRDQVLEELVGEEAQIRAANGAPPQWSEYANRFPDRMAAAWRGYCHFDSLATNPGGILAGHDQDEEGPPAVSLQLAARSGKGDLVSVDFGNYQFMEELGRGGMGVVYKAHQSNLNRTVALKMIRSGELASAQEIRRFQKEAEAVAKLDHPGIVPIFEVGEHDGQPWYSMGFIEGENLAEKLVDGPLSSEEAANLTIKIAEAIAHANENGVIHRDLKPANVLMDSKGQPRVTDFGLAKKTDADSGMTATGQILGTPSFMPPEQASGQTSRVDARADVYSIGAILYNLVTGRPPFLASSPMETLTQVLNEDPAPPRQLNPAIPRDIETICLKCLRKERERRYETASDLAADLRRWLNHEPIVARPVSAVEKCWKWARRHPGIVRTTAAAIVLLMVVVWIARSQINAATATQIVRGLLPADTSQVNTIIGNLSNYRKLAKDDLQQAFDDSPNESNAKLHAALAMLSDDKSVLPFLLERLLTVTPMQFQYVRDLLEDDKDELVEYYWQTAKENETPALRFQAACSLATYDSKNKHWEDKEFCKFLAGHLVGVRPSELLPWTNALRPVKGHLREPLSTIYADPDAGEQVRSFATDTLADYTSEDAETLLNLLADANEKQFAPMFDKLTAHQKQAIELANAEVTRPFPENASEDDKETLAMRQANAAVMLLRMNAADQVWPLLKHSPDPRVRSYIIHWLSPRGGEANKIIARYEQETDVTIKRALLLCLGEFELAETEQQPLLENLLGVYRNDPDAGLHAASEWLLRQWQQGEKLAAIDKELQQSEEQLTAAKDNKRQWYVNGEGQTFVILDAGEFQMGSPESETGRLGNERLHQRKIDRRIAVATKEVTREQWRVFSASNAVFSADNNQLKPYILSDDSPMTGLKWFEAAQYCNWLSQQEGIPEEQWCYEPNEKGEYDEGMKAKEKFWELTAYRLPTEAEWEYAYRAKASSSRYYGFTESLLPRYAWYMANGNNHTHPVASLKPNDFGLFDMQGNALEWCYEAYYAYPTSEEEEASDSPSVKSVEVADSRLLRGGSFLFQASIVRSAYRSYFRPDSRGFNSGFRPARTYHIFP